MERIVVVVAAAAFAACGPSVKNVSVDPPQVTLGAKGATAALKATPRDEKGAPVTEAVKVAWSSSAPLVASVDESGRVTALKSGEATVTAAVGEAKGSAKVLVAIPASIAVAPASLDLKAGESGQLEAKLVDDSGKPMAPKGVAWASSNAAVATVSNGRVTAVGGGQASITASAGALKAQAAVSVKVPEFARLSAKPARVALAKGGDSARLSAAALDRKGKPVAGVPVAWKSSNEAVVRVGADGTVAAVKKGKAKVTASAGGKTAAVEVTVRK